MQILKLLSFHHEDHAWPLTLPAPPPMIANVTGFVKRGIPLLQLWETITSCRDKVGVWNFYHALYSVSTLHWENFESKAFACIKLWIGKVGSFDACGRPLFANPVTYVSKLFPTMLISSPCKRPTSFSCMNIKVAIATYISLFFTCMPYNSYGISCGLRIWRHSVMWIWTIQSVHWSSHKLQCCLWKRISRSALDSSWRFTIWLLCAIPVLHRQSMCIWRRKSGAFEIVVWECWITSFVIGLQTNWPERANTLIQVFWFETSWLPCWVLVLG